MGADSLRILIDSLVAQKVAAATASTPIDTAWDVIKSILDVVYKLGMVVIALVNIYFAKKLQKHQEEKQKEKSTSDHKVMLLKTLILDYNLKTFFEFFDKLTETTDKLKVVDVNIKEIEPELQKKFKYVNQNFVDLLQGIDEDLYDTILAYSDDTRDLLIENISTYKLENENNFKEHIVKPISRMKKDIIRELFMFK